MGWDEALFGWMWSAARKLGRREPSAEERAREVTLERLRERLRVAASALAERPVEIREAEREGGFGGATLFLPARVDLAPTVEENEGLYLVRVAWAVTAMRAGLILASLDPFERALATALAAPAIRARLAEDCPGAIERVASLEAHTLAARSWPDRASPAARALELVIRARLGDRDAPERGEPSERAWLDLALARAPDDRGSLERDVAELAPRLLALGARGAAPTIPILWGAIGSPAPDARAGESDPGATPGSLASGKELRAKPREHVRRVELPEDPVQDNPLVHSFEKVHTAEEHRGGSKNADGRDELDDHAAALDELDLREVVRSTERTESLLRSDAMLEGTAGDLIDEAGESGGIPYDEWHEAERAYRPAWCRVRPELVQPRVAPEDARAYVAALRARSARRVDAIRGELQRLEHARRWRARQLDGSEVDEDAVVDHLAALRSGHSGAGRLYRAKRRHAPELAVLLLLDASLSTDGWIADRRVLDVELESALSIAEALDETGVELGIAAFHSHTRRDCRFTVVKGTTERWGAVQDRLASIEPAGYTRIGPALRHATRVLERTSARRRLLLLLTDGKPNDYDRYEGRYGVADVRQAVREAERASLHVHALAFDREARFHLPRMFGSSRHTVVADPDQLPMALGQVCADMAP